MSYGRVDKTNKQEFSKIILENGEEIDLKNVSYSIIVENKKDKNDEKETNIYSAIKVDNKHMHRAIKEECMRVATALTYYVQFEGDIAKAVAKADKLVDTLFNREDDE